MSHVSSKQVKTRSRHVCWGCGKTYPIGTMMERQTEADGGQVWSVYWCDICMDYMTSMPDWVEGDGIDFGGLMEDEEYIKFKQYKESSNV